MYKVLHTINEHHTKTGTSLLGKWLSLSRTLHFYFSKNYTVYRKFYVNVLCWHDPTLQVRWENIIRHFNSNSIRLAINFLVPCKLSHTPKLQTLCITVISL